MLWTLYGISAEQDQFVSNKKETCRDYLRPGSDSGTLRVMVDQGDVTIRWDQLSSRVGKLSTSGENQPDINFYQIHLCPYSASLTINMFAKTIISCFLDTPRRWPWQQKNYHRENDQYHWPKRAPSMDLFRDSLKLWHKYFLLWFTVTWFSQRESWSTEEKSFTWRRKGEEYGEKDDKEWDEGGGGEEHLTVCGSSSGRWLLTGTLEHWAVTIDSTAVSLFVDIFVEFDQYWFRSKSK